MCDWHASEFWRTRQKSSKSPWLTGVSKWLEECQALNLTCPSSLDCSQGRPCHKMSWNNHVEQHPWRCSGQATRQPVCPPPSLVDCSIGALILFQCAESKSGLCQWQPPSATSSGSTAGGRRRGNFLKSCRSFPLTWFLQSTKAAGIGNLEPAPSFSFNYQKCIVQLLLMLCSHCTAFWIGNRGCILCLGNVKGRPQIASSPPTWCIVSTKWAKRSNLECSSFFLPLFSSISAGGRKSCCGWHSFSLVHLFAPCLLVCSPSPFIHGEWGVHLQGKFRWHGLPLNVVDSFCTMIAVK